MPKRKAAPAPRTTGVVLELVDRERDVDLDEMIEALVYTVHRWWEEGIDTEETGFDQLRVLFYSAFDIPLPTAPPAYPPCPFCGGHHPARNTNTAAGTAKGDA